MSSQFNKLDSQTTLKTALGKFVIFSLPKLEKLGHKGISRLPFSIKILLECAVRNLDHYQIQESDIGRITSFSTGPKDFREIAFKPSRVILQDFTGVPCIVDLAAMRDAVKCAKGDYHKVNPQILCDLVIDHSLQVDCFGTQGAFKKNLIKEFQRNRERYQFLKWGQNAFKNFRVIPPATGIIHQINLEYLAKGVLTKKQADHTIAYPDSVIGTDSHTTMVNSLGIVGWGVGGIEAEAVMLGEPIYMLLPDVVGFKLTGQLKEGVNATDLVLTVTEILRKKNVVGKFVEFFGSGIKSLALADRATISNMAPEFGATLGLFPIDNETLEYYKLTGRSPKEVDLIERYFKEQGMFYDSGSQETIYSDVVELNLQDVETSLAGPKRPHDRVNLAQAKQSFLMNLRAPTEQRGFGLSDSEFNNTIALDPQKKTSLAHGAVVLASITSCANTSNPSVLIGAGLLAQKAVLRGLSTKSYVKTSLAPGSLVVTEYLKKAKLMPYLEKLGFNLVGYGCATCIGNSGPLAQNVTDAITKGDLVAVSVLSGNRNFEGRIHPLIKANYLASPLLVVAYALAGRFDIDLLHEPVGQDKTGEDVFLRDIWPTQEEINKTLARILSPKMFHSQYKNIYKKNSLWNKIKAWKSDLYPWNKKSTYIQPPPYFENAQSLNKPLAAIKGCRALLMLGDSITTDHISPAGAIAEDSPAGQYLKSLGVKPMDFNSYGSRRGNDQVMARGTFANIRLLNQLIGSAGPYTIYSPENKRMFIYDAAQKYKKDATPLLVIAGKEYGTGSSRDWAAKGPALLGIKVVLAQSFERIHRSNLIGMGILPLQFKEGDTPQSLFLRGDETFDFYGLSDQIQPGTTISVAAMGADSAMKEFSVKVRLDTQVEVDYYKNGGILPYVMKKILS